MSLNLKNRIKKRLIWEVSFDQNIPKLNIFMKLKKLEYLKMVMTTAHGNMELAADIAGVKTNRIYQLLREFDLDRKDFVVKSRPSKLIVRRSSTTQD